jgi:general secretion pathway protein D
VWRILVRACVAAVICGLLVGCANKDGFIFPSQDVIDPIRDADLRARNPGADRQAASGGRSNRPILVPGSDTAPTAPLLRDVAQDQPPGGSGAVATPAGVEFNFEGADIPTVARSLLGDVLGLAFVVDQRVQGTVTLMSAGPVARKDVLPIAESVFRMSNAAVVRDGNLLKIVPLPEAAGAGGVRSGAGQPGYGVTVVPLRYTSAASVAKAAENFMSRPGAIRVDAARNLLLVQGTTTERQQALDMVASFDVEWLRNQSVGVFPLKSTTPETMIQELDRIFQTGDGGAGQGAVQLQPISRMNAVMVVTKSQQTLERVTQWVRRLDRSDAGGNALRSYRLRYGNAKQVAKILNDIFIGRGGGAAAETPASQLAPGVASAQSRLDSLGAGTQQRSAGGVGTATASSTDQSGVAGGAGGRAGPMGQAFENFAGRQQQRGGEDEANLSGLTSGSIGRGVFQNVRISADEGNNSIVIYSNQEDFRIIEQALHDLDRPQLQVSIDATVAEVTLTNDLQYGVQHFFTSADAHMAGDKGSVGLFGAPSASSSSSSSSSSVAQAVQTAFLQRVLPGFNLLLGPEAQPRVILSALSTLTDVKVLSSPSLVVVDNQPALLEVGNQIPVTTSSATLLTNPNTPVVNTIDMRSTGVILKILPRIHANGVVLLEIEQEISTVVNPSQQTLTPTIAQRRIHSTVSVTSGQTVLLGGLISEELNDNKTGIPGLAQIKYLGDIFGNTSKDRKRSEIIIFVRPQVIRNAIDAQGVAQEFRERLETMRAPAPVIEGRDVPAAPAPANSRRTPAPER